MASSQRPAHSRRAARMAALQILYEVDSTGHEPDAVLVRRVAEEGLAPEAAAFTEELVRGVLGNLERADELIQKAAPAWPFAQMAKIDRNIIRMAIYESLLRDERLPFKIAVNEAVELAKAFGSESSSRFVNGVVGRIFSEETERLGGGGPHSQSQPERG